MEAVRLAATLRVLLYDTPKCVSLLNQLGVKNSLLFVSTGYIAVRQGATFIGSPLAPIDLCLGVEPGHVALLHEAPRIAQQPFYVWWKAAVIGAQSGPSTSNLFTREDVVKALAHDEGGAHVSPKVSRKYADLRQLGTGAELRNSRGLVVEHGNPALPTARQIAFEVDVTVNEQLADLLQ